MGGGRGVAAPGSGNTESGRLVACREEGEERHKIACILVTFHSHTLDIPSVGAVSRSGNIVISFFVLERLCCQ